MKNQNHHWSKEDYIVTFFITKYGTSGLYMRNDQTISSFIGTSVCSLKKMTSNFRHLLGVPNQLSHIKHLQQEVFNEYHKKPYMEFYHEVRNIVKQDETTRQLQLEKMGKTNYRLMGQK